MNRLKNRKIGLFNKKASIVIDETTAHQIRNLVAKKIPIKAIARCLHLSRNTVKKYMGGNPGPKQRQRSSAKLFLMEHIDAIQQYFYIAGKNCAVVQQKVKENHGIFINLRMIQRFCVRFRETAREAVHTLRFETKPGQQEQIDFGEECNECLPPHFR